MYSTELQMAIRASKAVDVDTEERMLAEGRTEELMQANLKLVASIVNSYYAKNQSKDDLFMVGMVGLGDAIANYDSGLAHQNGGVRFATHAQWWIRRAVAMAVKEDNLVHIPYNVQGENAKKVKEGEEVIDYKVASMDAMIGDGATMHDLIGEDGVLEVDSTDADVRAVVTAMDLDARERFILVHSFGLDEGEEWTLDEMSSSLGISGERVRQIKNDVLKRMKKQMK